VIVHIAPGAMAAPSRVSWVPANHYVRLVGTATTGAAVANNR